MPVGPQPQGFLHDRGAGAAETGAGRGDTAGVADLARPGHEAIDVVAGEPGVLNGGENRVDGERQGGVASVASDARLADAGDDDLVLKAVAHAVTAPNMGYPTSPWRSKTPSQTWPIEPPHGALPRQWGV